MSTVNDHHTRIAAGRVAMPGQGRTRYATVCILIALACLAMLVLSLTTGDYGIPLADLRKVIDGSDEMARIVVVEWRLPRALIAILLGGALAVSGALFQSLTRNPLGSPDIIGFTAGAHTGALTVILLLSGGYALTAFGAVGGGALTALAIYLLSYRHGLHGFRLIIVGVGIAAMLSAVNVWMIRSAELQVAMAASIWAAGSLNGLGLDRLVPVAAALAVMTPAVVWLARPMRQLELGDDVATASGVDVERTRLLLAVVGVVLVAIATAAAGPIAFVALAAPQLARRLTGSAGMPLLAPALTGALLLVVADWAAQHAFGFQLPVGVMTFNIGGFYFLWLLLKEGRK